MKYRKKKQNMQNLRGRLKCKILLLHRYLMVVGKWSGCHQIPERSFSIKGMQFPICARCTGIVLGYIIDVIFLLIRVNVPVEVCASFIMLMFLDWFVQYIEILPSTNIQRFVTGTLCGIGYFQIIIKIVRVIIDLIK